MRWSKLALAILCLQLLNVAAQAATVKLRDGSVVGGSVQLDGDGIVVHRDGSDDARYSLDQIQRVDFLAKAPATQQVPVGSGALKAEYFAGTDFDPAHRNILTCDFSINGRWDEHNNPLSTTPGSWAAFCVRWTGRITPLYSERYWFHVGPQQFTRVWIDHRLVVDEQADINLPVALEAGKAYDIRADQVARNHSYTLTWQSQSQNEQVVPSRCLSVCPDDPDPAVVSHIVSPDDGFVLAGKHSLPVRIQIDAFGRHISRVDLYDTDRLVKTFSSEPYQMTWQDIPMGQHILEAKAIDDADHLWPSMPSRINVLADNQGQLAAPWGRSNIGNPPVTGSAAGDAGKMKLSCSGGELLVGHDRFQFVMQPLKGNGEIIARLADLRADHAGAGVHAPLAGLMIRRSLDADCEETAILFSPDLGSVFINRKQAGAAGNSTATPSKSPGYLRLTREGPQISAYRSDDGSTWEFVASAHINLPQLTLAGLVLCSQTDASAATAVFDHIQLKTTDSSNENLNVSSLQLVDGTVLNGSFGGIDKGEISLDMTFIDGQPRRVVSVPASAAARMIYHPIKPESLQGLAPSDTGVILRGGDCFIGQITQFQNDTVDVSSDVFGPRSFRVHENVSAVLLRPITRQAARYQLTLRDGSVIQVAAMSADSEGITVDSDALKGLRLPTAALAELVVKDQK